MISDSLKPAVFLDRDGVLIEDVNLLARPDQIRVLNGVPESLSKLRQAGFLLIVVTNQSIVARGLCSESEIEALQEVLAKQLQAAGAPVLDAFYFCPHHPNATLPAYRVACDCRKPRPGMLHRAAREHGLDLARSFLIGDRLTDIAAGATAGCRTIWAQTGQHTAPSIQTVEPMDPGLQPDFTCASLVEATQWILRAV